MYMEPRSSESNRSGPDSLSKREERMAEKYEDLKGRLKRRENDLRKVTSALKQLANEKARLVVAYEARCKGYKVVAEANVALRRALSSGGCDESGPCEHETTLQEIQIFYETQLEELSNTIEEHRNYIKLQEDQQIKLAKERSLADFGNPYYSGKVQPDGSNFEKLEPNSSNSNLEIGSQSSKFEKVKPSSSRCGKTKSVGSNLGKLRPDSPNDEVPKPDRPKVKPNAEKPVPRHPAISKSQHQCRCRK